MKRISIILILALLLRAVVSVLYPLTGDSFLHISAARYIAETGMYPSEDVLLYGAETSFFYPPLIHYTMAILIKTLNLSYLNYSVLKVLTLLAGVISIYYCYLLLIEMGVKERDSELASLVLAFLPVHVFYSSVLYLDIFTALFVPMSVLYLIRGVKNKRFSLPFVMSCALASWTYILGLVAPLFALVYFLVHNKKIRKFLPYLIAAILLSSPFYIYSYLKSGQLIWTGRSETALSEQRSVIGTFYSLWIGSPNSGPGYQRIMGYLPGLQIPMMAWSFIFAAISLLAIFRILKINRELQILLILSLPGLIVFPEFISKVLSAAPAIALALYYGLDSVPLKREYVVAGYCILLLHVIPFAYMLGQRWYPYSDVYGFVGSQCSSILTGDVGRVSVNTDKDVTTFGKLGLDLSNLLNRDYESVLDDVENAGVDCVFYDTYTLENLIEPEESQRVSEFMDYIGCSLLEQNGISFYFCRI